MTELAAFHAALEENDGYVLTELKIQPWFPQAPDLSDTADFKSKLKGLDFYMTLNKAGRVKLLLSKTTPATEEWIQAMSNHDDPGIIYYFLRKNPTLCYADPNYKANANIPIPSAWSKFLLYGDDDGGFFHDEGCPQLRRTNGKCLHERSPTGKKRPREESSETHLYEEEQKSCKYARRSGM